MNKLTEKYNICLEKFKIHSRVLEKNGISEISSSKSGSYYDEKRIDFFEMYVWMTSFVTGLAPMYYKTQKDSQYLIWANRFETAYRDKVFAHSIDTMHDLGFLYSPYSVEMYKLTGSESHRETALKAADELLKRFDINGRYIDAWGRMDNCDRVGRAIVDCMMNIQLLLWAWKETGHTMYRDVAKAHADTTAKYFLREDGTVCHSFEFDIKTGEIIHEANNCGYANGSFWARGAAWAAYGFAMASRYLGSEEYYNISEKIIEKYISELPEADPIPVWDFRLPEDMPAKANGNGYGWDESIKENLIYNKDSSAAAIFACAIQELCAIKENKAFSDYADRAIAALCTDEYFDSDVAVPGIIKKQNGRMEYTPYGDYFFVQALQKKLFDTESCW